MQIEEFSYKEQLFTIDPSLFNDINNEQRVYEILKPTRADLFETFEGEEDEETRVRRIAREQLIELGETRILEKYLRR